MVNYPLNIPKKIICDLCDYKCNNLRDFNIHVTTSKHLKNTNGNKMEINNSPLLIQKKILCEICNYKCNKESEFKKHINSVKHIKNTNNTNNIHSNINLKCIRCNKQYKTASGIWKHNKTCINLNLTNEILNEDITENTILDSSSNEIKALTELVLELVKNNTELQKQNQDFQKQVLEICKNNNNTIINNTNSNNMNTTNNKTFNLQVFLNEECKDAMNMSEFINSIQVKLSDLENIDNQGYIEGVSNIIINHLNKTEMYKRPFHCSDAKRETLYIKEENKWEKEGPDNNKMKKAVRGVEKKNFLMLNQWKEKYPKCLDSESTQSDAYMHLISKLMNGDEENINKVIKKLVKEVVIEKGK